MMLLSLLACVLDALGISTTTSTTPFSYRLPPGDRESVRTLVHPNGLIRPKKIHNCCPTHVMFGCARRPARRSKLTEYRTASIDSFNMGARWRNYILKIGNCVSYRYKTSLSACSPTDREVVSQLSASWLKDETIFHPWLKDETIISGYRGE